jgi:methylated-DNA-[protein]-cysteine S-methyltransferase
MSETGFALFETAIGVCAIAWSAAGISGLQLPESDKAYTLARTSRRFGAAREAPPPPWAAQVIADVGLLLEGRLIDLSRVALDLERIPPFDRQVFERAQLIPPGRTQTYGQIATALGDPALARAVGQALGRNPFALIVPCHRVLAARGRIGGFSAAGGAIAKQRLLAIEGARVGDEADLFDAA